jgi:glycosyltransferase involved in cell wall biosynthesis
MEEGISFIVRVHNEEKTLDKCIRSLFGITVPHEIIIILHRCTDRSEEIAYSLASENPHIGIIRYEYPVSRAGYENLVTDKDSDHSLVYYSTWCLKSASYLWTFRWDADFIASNELITFINRNIWSQKNMSYRICAKNKTTENCELYLSSCLETYTKYLFWEAPKFNNKNIVNELDKSICIEHDSELSDLKSYWNEKPWFYTQNSPEALKLRERYERVVKDFGPEKPGMARASNEECHSFFYKLVSKRPDYIQFTQ